MSRAEAFREFERLLLVFVILLGPAAALWAIEVVVGLAVPRARRWAHAVLLAVVGAAAADRQRHLDRPHHRPPHLTRPHPLETS